MSRIGKMPVAIPKGVTVKVDDGMVKTKGPKGELSRPVSPQVEIKVEADEVIVLPTGTSRQHKAMHGLARSLIQNLVTGVSTGFTRVLEVNGVGYRADVKGRTLHLALGYSHPIEVLLPEGVDASVEKNRISLTGTDIEVLGQLAAVIRQQRPPEPYKGKGIRYIDEHVRRKVGKAGIA